MAKKNPLLRRILSLSTYLLIAVVFALLVSERMPKTLAVGTMAPLDERLTLLEGGTVPLKQFLKKPMVINFWATWCPPCLKELPTLSKMAKKYQGQITFVGALLASDIKNINELKKRYALNYELGTMNDQAVERFHARAMPTTYIVESTGKIIWAHAGVVSENELEDAIRVALTH